MTYCITLIYVHAVCIPIFGIMIYVSLHVTELIFINEILENAQYWEYAYVEI